MSAIRFVAVAVFVAVLSDSQCAGFAQKGVGIVLII